MSTASRDTTVSRPRTIQWGNIVVASIGIAIGAVLIVGSATMDVRGQEVPGPQFFPLVIAVLLVAMSTFLLVKGVVPAKRVPEPDSLSPDVSLDLLRDLSQSASTAEGPTSDFHGREAVLSNAVGSSGLAQQNLAQQNIDWKRLGTATAAIAGFILILPIAGWIVSCTLLFAAMALAFGSRQIWFNLLVGLLIGSLVQLVFSGLLGLSLPSGIIGQIG